MDRNTAATIAAASDADLLSWINHPEVDEYDRADCRAELARRQARENFATQITGWSAASLLDYYARGHAGNAYGARDGELAVVRAELLRRMS